MKHVLDISKSVTHDRFMVTALTEEGDVKKIKEGRFGARKVAFTNGIKATLKPKLHSTKTFRDIKRSEQCYREVAAYQLDYKVLHFGVVPVTTLTMYKRRAASLQLWVMGYTAKELEKHVFDAERTNWKAKVAKFATKVNVVQVRRMILLDLLANNTDRHAKNALFDSFSGAVWAIDNGLMFGRRYRYYHNVFHQFLYRTNLRLSKSERKLLAGITKGQLAQALGRYLSERDILETYLRAQWMLEQPNLGFMTIANELEGKDEFPSYDVWFDAKVRGEKGNRILTAVSAMGTPAI